MTWGGVSANLTITQGSRVFKCPHYIMDYGFVQLSAKRGAQHWDPRSLTSLMVAWEEVSKPRKRKRLKRQNSKGSKMFLEVKRKRIGSPQPYSNPIATNL